MTSARMENRVRLISPVIQIPGIGMLGWGFFSPTSTSVTSHYTYRHIANVNADPFESVHPLFLTEGTILHRAAQPRFTAGFVIGGSGTQVPVQLAA